MEIGRKSQPEFQTMNFQSTRKKDLTVVWQHGEEGTDPLCPLTLLIAYEEYRGV